MRPPDPGPSLLRNLADEALREAWWERLEMSTRRPADLVPDLLRARAAELALSPIGRDQILSRAMDLIAERRREPSPVDADVLFGGSPTEEQRLAVRQRVFAAGAQPSFASSDAAARVEERHRRSLADGSAALISHALTFDAALHETLWDDPRAPASDPVRLALLCSVPKLRERAAELAPRPLGIPATFWPKTRGGQ